MADKTKRVFTIEINGISESIDSVKALNDQLESLSNSVKNLQNAKVEVKVSGNVDEDTSKTKVSGGTAKTAEQKADLENQKLIAEQIALQNEQLRQQLVLNEQIKASNKEQKQLIKDIAAGIKDENGNYTETLAGMRAQLAAMKKQLAQMKPDDDGWDELIEKTDKLNTKILDIEKSYGTFSRQVGHYEIIGDSIDKMIAAWQNMGDTIGGVKDYIKQVSAAMENVQFGSEQWEQMNDQLQQAKDRLDEMKQALGDTEAEAPGFATTFTTTINGVTYEFKNAQEAIEKLQKQLVNMAASGDTSSKKFQALQQEVVRLRNAVKTVDGSIAGLVSTSKGLNAALSIFSGFGAVAGMGLGLQNLFGFDSEELNKTTQKLVGIMAVLQSMKTLQNEMQQKTDFGNLLNSLDSGINKIFGKVGSLFKSVSEKISEIEDQVSKIAEKKMDLLNLKESFANAKENVEKYKQQLMSLSTSMNLPTIDELMGMRSDEVKNRFGDIVDEIVTKLKQAQGEVDFSEKLGDSLDNALEDANERLDEMAAKIPIIGKSVAAHPQMWKKITVAIKGATAAMKSFLASTVLLLVLQLLVEGIVKLFEGFISLFKGPDKDAMKNVMEGVTAAVEGTYDAAKRLTEQMTRLRKEGDKVIDVSDYNKLRIEMENLGNAFASANFQLVKLVNSMDDLEAMDFSKDYFGTWGNDSASQNLEEFTSKYKELQRVIMEGSDSGENWFTSAFWFTNSDAVDDFKDANAALIKDLGNTFRGYAQAMQKAIDVEGENWMNDAEKLDRVIAKAKQLQAQWGNTKNLELYASAMSQIDKLFPDDPQIQSIKNLFKTWEDGLTNVINLEQKMLQLQAQQAKTIEDNLAAAIGDSYKRGVEQRRLAREREIADAEGNAELIASINKKYDQQDKEAREAHNKEMLSKSQSRNAAERAILQNRLAAQRGSLDKELQLLELQKEAEIESARAAGVKVGEATAAINDKYAKLILSKKKEWWAAEKDAQAQLLRSEIEQENDYLSQIRGIADEIADIKRQISSDKIDQLQTETEADFSVPLVGEEGLEQYRKYYSEILKMQNEWDTQREQIALQSLEQQSRQEVDAENERYRQQLQSLEDYQKSRKQEIEEAYESGYITEEQSRAMLQALEESFNQQSIEMAVSHADMLQALEEKSAAERLKIQKEYDAKRKENVAKALDNEINQYKEFFSKIQREQQKQSQRNKSGEWGIINYKKERENIDKAIGGYKDLAKSIEKEQKDLEDKLKQGKISFVDYQKAKKDLEDLKKDTNEALKDILKDSKNLLNNFLGSVTGAIASYGSQLSGLWDTFSAIQTLNLDQQQEELDRQKEMLDKELEQLEEAYEAQEELTEKHKDKISELEDELADSRGARREALIDQLAAEQAAMIAEMENANELQKNKEENAKKEEELAAKQAVIDKKRKELEKKNSIIQATISTATAVTNALSVQPWFVGVALAAVAAALGAVQIAKIKSQKFYADGGLLSGPSHASGGIKVGATGIEVEGGEYVVNKASTAKNLEILEYINSQRRTLTASDLSEMLSSHKSAVTASAMKFASGGVMPELDGTIKVKPVIETTTADTDDRPVVVSVVDIINQQDNLRKVQVLAGADA